MPGKEELSFANTCLVHALLSVTKEGTGGGRGEMISSMSGGTLGNMCMELH